MDKEIQEVLDMLINNIEIKVCTRRVGDINYEQFRSTGVNCSNKYNDYKIEDFLVLYKIEYLESNFIIDFDTANYLRDLVFEKLKITEELGKLISAKILDKDLYDENKEKANKLLKKSNEIESILNKYHLIITREDILNMFLNSINVINDEKVMKKI